MTANSGSSPTSPRRPVRRLFHEAGLAIVRSQFSGNDLIQLSGFDDHMRGFNGNDRMYGRDGSDLLQGDRGKDKLFGGADNDTLKGGAGNDIVPGGKGRDKEFGVKGEDTFIFETGDDRSIIRDFDAKGGAHDVLDLSGLTSIRNWSDLKNNHLVGDGTDVVIDAGEGDIIVLQNVSLNSLDRGDFVF